MDEGRRRMKWKRGEKRHAHAAAAAERGIDGRTRIGDNEGDRPDPTEEETGTETNFSQNGRIKRRGRVGHRHDALPGLSFLILEISLERHSSDWDATPPLPRLNGENGGSVAGLSPAARKSYDVLRMSCAAAFWRQRQSAEAATPPETEEGRRGGFHKNFTVTV